MIVATPMVGTEAPTESLRPNPLNPRGEVSDDAALRELAESIREQGILQPLLIDPHGRVIAGHRRLAAANLVGLKAGGGAWKAGDGEGGMKRLTAAAGIIRQHEYLKLLAKTVDKRPQACYAMRAESQ